MSDYQEGKATEKAGGYSGAAHAGVCYVWDAVLEYRVWCHPGRGVSGGED